MLEPVLFFGLRLNPQPCGVRNQAFGELQHGLDIEFFKVRFVQFKPDASPSLVDSVEPLPPLFLRDLSEGDGVHVLPQHRHSRRALVRALCQAHEIQPRREMLALANVHRVGSCAQ
jgi:hypothetical protein